MSPSSGLAATIFRDPQGSDMGLKVFYVGNDSRLSEAIYTKATKWLDGTAIGPTVSSNSSLAVSLEPDTLRFQVYYRAADTDGTLSQISYNSGAQWSTGTVIKASSSPFPSLAAVSLAKPFSRWVYFVNSTRHIEAVSSTDGGATWTALTQTADLLPLADTSGSAIAATSWLTKVRLFYIASGQLTEMSMKGSDQLYVLKPVAAEAFTDGDASGNNGSSASSGTSGKSDGTATTTGTAPSGTGADDKTTEGDGRGPPETGLSDKETEKGEPMTADKIIGMVTGGITALAALISGLKYRQKVWNIVRWGRPSGSWIRF